MRPFIGLLMLLAIVGCADSGDKSGKSALQTDRCSDIAPVDSAEYQECRKKEAERDAQRMYELRRSVDTVPSWLPPTSLPH